MPPADQSGARGVERPDLQGPGGPYHFRQFGEYTYCCEENGWVHVCDDGCRWVAALPTSCHLPTCLTCPPDVHGALPHPRSPDLHAKLCLLPPATACYCLHCLLPHPTTPGLHACPHPKPCLPATARMHPCLPACLLLPASRIQPCYCLLSHQGRHRGPRQPAAGLPHQRPHLRSLP